MKDFVEDNVKTQNEFCKIRLYVKKNPEWKTQTQKSELFPCDLCE